MSDKITNSPNLVNVVPVSTTTSPVTHVAEVEVNKAFRKERPFPSSVEIGRVNKYEPISIKAAKPITRIFGGSKNSFAFFKINHHPNYKLIIMGTKKAKNIFTFKRPNINY